MIRYYAIFFFCCLSSLGWAQKQKVLLKTDFEGEVVEGSIATLISEIQSGAAIRVGWELDFDEDHISDLEHWVDAEFISILEGHVFNQIRPIYRQIPNVELPQIEIVANSTQWTAIIGTNGKLISRFIIPDLMRIENESIRKLLQEQVEVKERRVATTWTSRQ